MTVSIVRVRRLEEEPLRTADIDAVAMYLGI